MGVVGVDRISRLPDALLHYILCFLPTKCAVCTSILSTRWRSVWVSIPILDFRKWRSHTTSTATVEDYDLENEIFMNFLDRILNLGDMPNIQKFYLHSEIHFDESRVNAWISSVIRRKVQELNVSLYGDNLLPPCFFTCESLTMLDLNLDAVLYLPESISFPRLKFVRLTFIQFIDENLTQQFFSSCPVLEELIMAYCSWINMNVVSISAPTLKCLFFDVPSVDGSDALDNCRVKINAPSLLSLRYCECVAKDYVLPSFPSLVNAEIDLMFLDDCLLTREEIGYSASKLLGRLSNVKLLTLSGTTFKALSFADDPLTNLPTFYNLIHLEVSLMFPCSANGTLLEFLQIAPNLESLVFVEGFNQNISNGDDSWALNLMSPYLLLHLKSEEQSYGAATNVSKRLRKLCSQVLVKH
ncbi:F-box domain [Macleaya cordata]|uniref:F-box domain n=1 Tax=Macleaya cordata TaxID=56857 RepID=A0A200QFD8_MACCD|nr:F-box domain [Macleaya cordata]